MQIEITVGETVYDAVLYGNEAAQAFAARLPMTVNMEELNGNEKYCYLDYALPSAVAIPDGIRTGDLKLFGDSCIVLFYENFSSGYSYTDIGYLENPEGLASALGEKSVEVSFNLKP
ncbi:MAG: cyclophilin-like fold protein [Oscillospiraceae bacterium]|nr:cyclophilin-like fold protein [Oscillospiraceae bacterium]